MLIDLLTSTCRSTQVKIYTGLISLTDLWPQEMFTFSEMLALVQSESSFGAYVCQRRPAGLHSDLRSCLHTFVTRVRSTFSLSLLKQQLLEAVQEPSNQRTKRKYIINIFQWQTQDSMVERSQENYVESSREMLVISRQNGLRLLSSRLSGYRQKATRWSMIGRCDDLHRQAPSQTQRSLRWSSCL